MSKCEYCTEKLVINLPHYCLKSKLYIKETLHGIVTDNLPTVFLTNEEAIRVLGKDK